MHTLPINLLVNGNKPVLVVGGGNVAERKVRQLRRAGFAVRVVSPVIVQGVREMLSEQCETRERRFVESDLDGVCLAVAATDEPEVNAQVSAAARAKAILVNVVDTPALCDFIFPSIVDRDPITISVSSGGASPVLARAIRAQIETLVPSSVGDAARFFADYRAKVKSRITDNDQRRDFWEFVVHSPVADWLQSGQRLRAERWMENALANRGEAEHRGEVYLVGAGPGDPDLLTFRALRLMQKADVVFYDRLVSEPILHLVRADAERIYVGKRKADHAVPQEEINVRLVQEARRGRKVLRLKGGDPFIFGRGGEEIAELAAEGIPFQIVPGITAANACASYAGIPLTHRDHAQSVRFATAHLRDGSLDLDWPSLVAPGQTLVFYMGLTGLSTLCERLIAHGMNGATPIALVEKGTLPGQRIFTGTLLTLPAIVAAADVHAPTLIIVGDVVKLHDTLRWQSVSEPGS